MSKRGFGKKSKLEFERLKKNARGKLGRLRKKVGIDISDDIFIPRSIEYFEDRNEFNEWKKEIESFTNRGNKNYQFERNRYGVFASKAELEKIQTDTVKAQEVAKDKIDEMKLKPVIQGGNVVGTLGQEMLKMARPNFGVTVPSDFNFDTIQTRRQFLDRMESMEMRTQDDYYEKRNDRMKENYIETLEKAFNSDAQKLADAIRTMGADDFLEMYNMFKEFDFEVFYDDNGDISDRNKAEVTKLESYMFRYQVGKIDMDFKGI